MGPLDVTWRDNATGQPVRIPCTNACLAMTRLQHLLPFLNWPRPDLKLLRNEAVAGLTVGLMVIPQGVAYAALAGMPLQTGIYAAMLPALVAVLFSASTRLSVGPTALTCLLVSSSLSGLATPGSAQWVALAMWLALLSGLLQVGLGLLRFGWLLNLVSAPVLMAFTQGAALLIISSQLPALLGLQGGWQALATLQNWHVSSALFGVGSLTLLTLARYWKPAFPSVLLVVLAAAGLSVWTGFEASGGAVVGQLPEGLPGLSLPGLPSWSVLSALVLPTLVITLVSFLETASSAKVDSDSAGQRWNQNQDLIGQGLGKIASGLSGAFPTSSSFARSALNIFAGAKTGWATLASVIVVLLSLLFFLPVLRHVPQAVLAAIVLTAVVGLLKPRAFVRLWRISRTEATIAGVTLALTLLTAPRLYWGVLAGVLMGLSHFLFQRLHPRIVEVGLDADGSLRDRHLWHLPPLASQVYALRMDAALEFASASSLEQAVVAYLSQHPDTRHVCLFAQPINRIDATGVECLAKLEALLAARQITLHISGMKLPVESVLRSAGCLQASPGLHLYRNDAEAVQQLQQLQPQREPIRP
jgi:SulP family sulfate permease